MNIGVIIAVAAIVAISGVAGWVISRQLTLKRISKLSKELGAEAVQGQVAQKRLEISEKIDKERGPLPIRNVAGAWRRLWGIRVPPNGNSNGR